MRKLAEFLHQRGHPLPRSRWSLEASRRPPRCARGRRRTSVPCGRRSVPRSPAPAASVPPVV